MRLTRRDFIVSTSALAVVMAAATPVFAQKKYDEGASDTEIKIGHTNPATPSFASEREFDIFQAQFEQACGRLWLQANVNS
jgi:hypothetical protein